jgi:hypothetical protein
MRPGASLAGLSASGGGASAAAAALKARAQGSPALLKLMDLTGLRKVKELMLNLRDEVWGRSDRGVALTVALCLTRAFDLGTELGELS